MHKISKIHLIKTAANIFLSSLLVAVLLFATTGFTLYKHYCNKEQKHEVSFMVDEDNCGHHDLSALSCHSSESLTSEKEENCCNHESDYFVLDEPVIKPENVGSQQFLAFSFIKNPQHFYQGFKLFSLPYPQQLKNTNPGEFSALYGVFLL